MQLVFVSEEKEQEARLYKGQREGWRFHKKQKELYVCVRGRNCVCCMCYQLFNLVCPLMQQHYTEKGTTLFDRMSGSVPFPTPYSQSTVIFF